ncbi:uncharacterized protein LOC122510435 [Leptopilina heterotoma]|uniref:uncharacterized protein LOC122510435 n=1 Tax=Leptopilina heterotoma TaxID=63436 RepID=UPI001CA93F37|nr:uncharacterized protein LOC122510435 [Leptopilina heterotoma]
MDKKLMNEGEKILEEKECLEIIKKKLAQESLNEFNLISHELVQIEEVKGYMGQYFTLSATIANTKSPKDVRKIKFFTKIPPPKDSPMYEFDKEMGAFKKEAAFYNHFLPKVLNGTDKKFIPDCFLCSRDEVIVLEDMTQIGFLPINKFVPFDFEHCRILIETLAKFHVKSFIFEEETKKNLQENFSHCMKESLWDLGKSKSKSLYDAAIKGAISLVDLIPGFDEKTKLIFKKKMKALSIERVVKLSPSVKHKNVYCHGDLWANNILFKYDENAKPVECCFVDFQHARYNPPAHDLLSAIHYTTTRKIRDEYSNRFYKIYYESLGNCLNCVEMEIEKIFPWEEFMKSVADQKIALLVFSVLNLPIMLLEPQAANKYFAENPELLKSVLYIDRTPLLCEQFQNLPIYRERIVEAYLDLYDYLDKIEL